MHFSFPMPDYTALAWGLGASIFLVWVRRALTPKWVIGLFESEGEPSIRLVLAGAVTMFSLLMQAAGRMPDALLETNYFFAGTLLGLGTAKVVGKAFASRPAETTVNANQVKADVKADNVTIAKSDSPSTSELTE